MLQINRNLANALLGILLAGVLITMYCIGSSDRKNIRCKSVHVNITGNSENKFITDESIIASLDSSGIGFRNMSIEEIDLDRIESTIKGQTAVKSCQAYVTKDGRLHINIEQRVPAVRFQCDSIGFYADSEGYLFPLQVRHSANIPIIDGNIPINYKNAVGGIPQTEKEREWLEQSIMFARYLNDNGTWRDRISQIHVDKDTNLILIPQVGEEEFIFGQPYSIAEKFEKMELYYKGIRSQKGEDTYKEIDLRFEKQIVCRNENE